MKKNTSSRTFCLLLTLTSITVAGCGGGIPSGTTSTQALSSFVSIPAPNLTSAYYSNYYFDLFAIEGNDIVVFKRDGDVFNQGETIGTSASSINFGSMNAPTDVTSDSVGNLIVADTGNNRIDVFFPNSSQFVGRTVFGTPGTGNGQFQKVVSVATDSSDNVYAVDQTSNLVEEWSYNGGSYSFDKNIGSGLLNSPVSIAIDAAANLYISNAGSKNIVVISGSTGSVINTITAPTSLASTFVPGNISLDANNNIYVVDTGNNQVEEFALAGGSYTYAGVIGSIGSGSEQYSLPTSVSIDSFNDIYIGDKGNNRVAAFPLP